MGPEISGQIKVKVLNDYLHHKGKSCNHWAEKVGREKGDINTVLKENMIIFLFRPISLWVE